MSNNANEPAFPSGIKNGLTKLEYALIHSTWEPSKESIEMEATRDRNKNPYNESNKPVLRSYLEIVRDLKIKYLQTLLS